MNENELRMSYSELSFLRGVQNIVDDEILGCNREDFNIFLERCQRRMRVTFTDSFKETYWDAIHEKKQHRAKQKSLQKIL